MFLFHPYYMLRLVDHYYTQPFVGITASNILLLQYNDTVDIPAVSSRSRDTHVRALIHKGIGHYSYRFLSPPPYKTLPIIRFTLDPRHTRCRHNSLMKSPNPKHKSRAGTPIPQIAPPVTSSRSASSAPHHTRSIRR